MTDPGVIRIDPQAPRLQRQRSWRGPALLAVGVFLAAGLAFGLGRFQGSGGAQSAVGVVEEFADAWNEGDVTAVDALIADRWDAIVLPGLVDPWLEPADGRDTLLDGITFLAGVTRLDLGTCVSEIAPPGSLATTQVRCRDGRFAGDYLDAVRRTLWYAEQTEPTVSNLVRLPGLTFGVADGEIVAVDDDARDLAPQPYCVWAEQTVPEQAVGLFDLNCRPATTPGDVAAHADLARAFAEAGSPLPSIQLIRSRLAAAYVERYVEHHNLGDTLSIRQWLSYDVSAADLPGYPGSAEEPSIPEFLLWSIRLLELAPGRCTVDFGEGVTVVTCPDMVVTGPLLDAPVPQPTRFSIDVPSRRQTARGYDRIVAVEPLGDQAVVLDDVCRRLQAADPAVAATAFTPECEPIFGRDGADSLLAALDSGT